MRAHRILLIAGLTIPLLALALPSAASTQGSSGKIKSSETAADTLAVCGCGMIFAPGDKTAYLIHDGQRFACCTEACHAMALKDPAAAAVAARRLTSQMLTQLAHMKLDVANVIEVTERGTKAACGCGKTFMIDDHTEYIRHSGKSYACCTHECHVMAAKDPAGAARSVEKIMSSM